MSKIHPNFSEIWIVELDPVVGHEQANERPCIIISVDEFNHSCADMVFILPLTTKNKKILWHVEIKAGEFGLKKDSYILCDQIRSVSKTRLLKGPIGKVSFKILHQISLRIRFLLGF